MLGYKISLKISCNFSTFINILAMPVCMVSHVWLFRLLCPWDSLGKITGVECHALWNLRDPGIEPRSLTSPALASRFFTTSTTWEAQYYIRYYYPYSQIRNRKIKWLNQGHTESSWTGTSLFANSVFLTPHNTKPLLAFPASFWSSLLAFPYKIQSKSVPTIFFLSQMYVTFSLP